MTSGQETSLQWVLPDLQEALTTVFYQALSSNQAELALQDGEHCQVEFCWISAQEGWFRRLDSHQQIRFFIADESDDVWQVWVAGRITRLKKPLSAAKKRRQGSVDTSGHVGDVKAPMPGTILKIMVEPGQTVEANQPVVVMESMKMEMTLNASGKAWVEHVGCVVGELVDMGTVLIQLKPMADPPEEA